MKLKHLLNSIASTKKKTNLATLRNILNQIDKAVDRGNKRDLVDLFKSISIARNKHVSLLKNILMSTPNSSDSETTSLKNILSQIPLQLPNPQDTSGLKLLLNSLSILQEDSKLKSVLNSIDSPNDHSYKTLSQLLNSIQKSNSSGGLQHILKLTTQQRNTMSNEILTLLQSINTPSKSTQVSLVTLLKHLQISQKDTSGLKLLLNSLSILQ